MRKLLKVFGVIMVFLVILAVICAGLGYRYYFDPVDISQRKAKFTISPETTFVTEPVDSLGYVDYEAAVNQRLSKGIKPDENAVVFLLKATGPNPERANLSDRFFQALGVPRPEKTSNDYINHRLFAEEKKAGSESLDPDFFVNEQPLMSQPWLAKDHPVCAEWLEKNAVALKYAEQASRCPKYYHPLIIPQGGTSGTQGRKSIINALLPIPQSIRDMAHSLIHRAMLKLGEGKHDEAWADLLTVHRLGRIASHGGCIIEMLVGYAIEIKALEADLIFLEHVKPNADKIQSLLKDLDKLPPHGVLAEKVSQMERIMFLDTLQNVYRYGYQELDAIANDRKDVKLPTRAVRAWLDVQDWDLMFRTGNEWYDRYEAACRIPNRAERTAEVEDLTTELHAISEESRKFMADLMVASITGSATAGQSERLAYLVLRLLSPSLNKFLNSNDRREQKFQNLRVAMALAAYQADHGKYPETLAVLQPKYLPTVPLDLFSGEPLIYEPDDKGYLLYSVGENGIDDGGQTKDDFPQFDDIVVRMPLPPLKK